MHSGPGTISESARRHYSLHQGYGHITLNLSYRSLKNYHKVQISKLELLVSARVQCVRVDLMFLSLLNGFMKKTEIHPRKPNVGVHGDLGQDVLTEHVYGSG